MGEVDKIRKEKTILVIFVNLYSKMEETPTVSIYHAELIRWY